MRARMTRIEMTIISSNRVKPRAERRGSANGERVRGRSPERTPLPLSPLPLARTSLPVTVLLPVERLAVGLRAHVEDVVGAGGAAAVGVVVVREQTPVLVAG